MHLPSRVLGQAAGSYGGIETSNHQEGTWAEACWGGGFSHTDMGARRAFLKRDKPHSKTPIARFVDEKIAEDGDALGALQIFGITQVNVK